MSATSFTTVDGSTLTIEVDEYAADSGTLSPRWLPGLTRYYLNGSEVTKDQAVDIIGADANVRFADALDALADL